MIPCPVALCCASARSGTGRDLEFERIAYSPDGEFVVTNIGSLGLQVWDSREGRKIRTIDFKMVRFEDFEFSPDGKVVAIVGWAIDERGAAVVSHLIFAEFASGRRISRIEGLQRYGTIKIAFAPDGKTLVTANDALRFWDVASGKMLFEASTKGERAPRGRVFAGRRESFAGGRRNVGASVGRYGSP